MTFIATLVETIRTTPLTWRERQTLRKAVLSAPKAMPNGDAFCRKGMHKRTPETVGKQGNCIPCKRVADRERYGRQLGRPVMRRGRPRLDGTSAVKPKPKIGDHSACDLDGQLCAECVALLEVRP